MIDAVPVNPGFGWTPALLVTLNAAILGLIGIIWRTRVPLKKIEADREINLLARAGVDMDALRTRIDKLEAQLEIERKEREALKAVHAAERSADRHRLNNITQCFDGLLMLIDTSPERASEAVVKIKAMRESQMKAEAVEKAAIHAVVLTKGETG